MLLGYAVITLSRQPAGLLSRFFTQFFGLSNQSNTALEVILQYSFIGLGIVVVANYLGINGAAMVTVAGGLSVGIGFGLKEIISNFISSIWMLFEGTVRPGEILMINGDPCTVRKLGLRATQLKRGRDGAELLIPNQTFFTQEAESFTAQRPHDAAPLMSGLHTTMNRVASSRFLLNSPKSMKRFCLPSTSSFHNRLWRLFHQLQSSFLGKKSTRSFVESDLRQVIWSRFEENDIGIPFPQRQVYPMEWPPSKQQTLELRHQADQHLLREYQNEESQVDQPESAS